MKIDRKLINHLKGIGKEIGYCGFKNYSQGQFLEMILKITEELENIK